MIQSYTASDKWRILCLHVNSGFALNVYEKWKKMLMIKLNDCVDERRIREKLRREFLLFLTWTNTVINIGTEKHLETQCFRNVLMKHEDCVQEVTNCCKSMIWISSVSDIRRINLFTCRQRLFGTVVQIIFIRNEKMCWRWNEMVHWKKKRKI